MSNIKDSNSTQHVSIMIKDGQLDAAYEMASMLTELHPEHAANKALLAECSVYMAELATPKSSNGKGNSLKTADFKWKEAIRLCDDTNQCVLKLYSMFRHALLLKDRTEMIQCFLQCTDKKLYIGSILCFHRYVLLFLDMIKINKLKVKQMSEYLIPLLELACGPEVFIKLLYVLQNNNANDYSQIINETCHFLGLDDLEIMQNNKLQLRKSGTPFFLCFSKLDRTTAASYDLFRSLVTHLKRIAHESVLPFCNNLRLWAYGLSPCPSVLNTIVNPVHDCNTCPYSHLVYYDEHICFNTTSIITTFMVVSNIIRENSELFVKQSDNGLNITHWREALSLFVSQMYPFEAAFQSKLFLGFNEIIKFHNLWLPSSQHLFLIARAAWIQSDHSCADEMEIYFAMQIFHAVTRKDVCQEGDRDLFVKWISEAESKPLLSKVQKAWYTLDKSKPDVIHSPLRLLIWSREMIYYKKDVVQACVYLVQFLNHVAHQDKSVSTLNVFNHMFGYTVGILMCLYAKASGKQVYIPERWYYNYFVVDKAQTNSTKAFNQGRHCSMIDAAQKCYQDKKLDMRQLENCLRQCIILLSKCIQQATTAIKDQFTISACIFLLNIGESGFIDRNYGAYLYHYTMFMTEDTLPKTGYEMCQFIYDTFMKTGSMYEQILVLKWIKKVPFIESLTPDFESLKLKSFYGLYQRSFDVPDSVFPSFDWTQINEDQFTGLQSSITIDSSLITTVNADTCLSSNDDTDSDTNESNWEILCEMKANFKKQFSDPFNSLKKNEDAIKVYHSQLNSLQKSETDINNELNQFLIYHFPNKLNDVQIRIDQIIENLKPLIVEMNNIKQRQMPRQTIIDKEVLIINVDDKSKAPDVLVHPLVSVFTATRQYCGICPADLLLEEADSPENTSSSSRLETYEVHCKSVKHTTKEIYFKAFVKLVSKCDNMVVEPLTKIEGSLEQLRNSRIPDIEKKVVNLQLKKDELDTILADIMKQFEEIKSLRGWAKTSGIDKKLNNIISQLNVLSPEVNKLNTVFTNEEIDMNMDESDD